MRQDEHQNDHTEASEMSTEAGLREAFTASVLSYDPETMAPLPIEIAAFYHFGALPNFAELRYPLQDFCRKMGVRGTFLLAPEGINATLAGKRAALHEVLAHIKATTGFHNLEHKSSFAAEIPFRRMKIRLKQEIVNLRDPTVDPRHLVGNYVEPQDWNALIADPDVVLIDVRNDYEVSIGTFKGAVDPKTHAFSDFPKYVAENLDPSKNKKVAMFCTGGIRCEKASSYMLSQGFEDVYHLKGGILKYLETVPEAQSAWEGECFVFDHRVAVGHGVAPSEVFELHPKSGHPVRKDRPQEAPLQEKPHQE